MSENEILVLLLGTAVLGFIVLYRREIHRLPAYEYLLAAYAAVWLAWFATLAEHVAFYTFFNVLEHVGYAANGVLLLIWCWKGLRQGVPEQHVHD
ncbi:MAG TPA: hypothetical protein VM553_07940 [Dongiaceae bacterium]|nr:hypothetical protein [Dongiaceae bacterium]